jgi:hypothetical protein
MYSVPPRGEGAGLQRAWFYLKHRRKENTENFHKKTQTVSLHVLFFSMFQIELCPLQARQFALKFWVSDTL